MDGLASSQMLSAQQHIQAADVYTDLNSLQNIKTSDDKDAALRQIAQQFESMFLSMMLKSMRDANAVFEEDSMFNSGDVKFYRDMHDQQLTLTLSHGRQGGVGIADSFYRQMSGANITSPQKGEISPLSATEIKDVSKLDVSKLDVPKIDVSKKDKYQPLSGSPSDFIEKVMPAVQKAAKKLGVDSSVLTAQAALETGWGKFILANEDGKSSFNLFNIKAGGEWQGKRVSVSAVEYTGGTFTPQQSSFRVYDSIEQSVEDYVEFVRTNPRYQEAMQSVDDAGRYIRELHKAGYATDPKYAEKVLSVHDRLLDDFGHLTTTDT
jgi:flagellar rod assembly protein/muramidase FlgJ